MIPAKGNSKPYNLIPITNNKNFNKLLKSAVILGPNASGKTNVIYALHAMRSLILHSKNMNKGDTFEEYEPFELDINYAKKPTSFGISFITDDIQYKYSISYNHEKIVSEELSKFIGKKEQYFFKRENGNLQPFIDHKELEELFHYTGDNVLFLSKANNEYKKFGPIFEWFNNTLTTVGSISSLSPEKTINYSNESDENKIKIINLLKFADFDIEGISGEISKIDNPKILSIFRELIINLEKSKNKSEKDDDLVLKTSEIKTVRRRTDGSQLIKDFSKFESAGTRTFFAILGLWLDALEKNNRIIIIDEFDNRLHPDLQYYLLKIFHDKEFNIKNSQIVFTTHNTRILATDFFRREQIWLTEKNRDNKATDLFSIFDYEKRNDRSIEKAYFSGRYGGLPDIIYKRF